MSSLSLAAPFRIMAALGSVGVFAGTIAFAAVFIGNLLQASSAPPVARPRLTASEVAGV